MTVKLLFFGAVADAIGSREFELAVDQETTARSIADRLSKQHPALTRHRLLTAVNEEHADADTVLNDGDEVAIFTAVSGG